MQNFLRTNALRLLMLVGMAGLGYCISMPPAATVARSMAGGLASHRADCPVCELPLFGQRHIPSRLGPDFRASANAAKAMHEGTIGE